MFEKEAEKYLKKLLKRLKIKEEDLVENQPKFISWEKMNFISLNVSNVSKAFQDGAEFGYNKANEWHYVKDGDLPKKELEEKQLLVRVRNYTEDYIFAYYMVDKYYSKNGKRFYSDIDCDYPIDIEDIIAWKEIELPKEIE